MLELALRAPLRAPLRALKEYALSLRQLEGEIVLGSDQTKLPRGCDGYDASGARRVQTPSKRWKEAVRAIQVCPLMFSCLHFCLWRRMKWDGN